MRTEEEMIDLIKDVAFQEENIRAAYMEGSRTNPNAPKDIFQDYDIVYVVTTTKPFRENKEWINRFGEILYMHYPEDNVFYPSDVENCYGWQVQFADGNRMDLHVCTREYALEQLELYKILVDKDGIMPIPREITDQRYWVKEPTEMEFQCTCSDFWWCLNNVAKGLWRDELPYVLDMINFAVRPQLKRLLEWKIGIENDFSINVGKSGKYMKKYLYEKEYQQFLATYSIAEKESIWDSVFEMCYLFQGTAAELSKRKKFVYDFEQAKNSLNFLRYVRDLPANAKEIYP